MNIFEIIETVMPLFIIALIIITLSKRIYGIKMAIILAAAFGLQMWAEAKQGKSLDMAEYAILIVLAIYFIFHIIFSLLKRKIKQPAEG